MRKEDFFEVLGELDGDIVKGAEVFVKKKMSRRAWGAIAACLGAAIIAASMIPQAAPIETDPRGPETAIETRSLEIYYLSENGTIEGESAELRCAPEDIFREWAARNSISEVTLISCVYDDAGSEQTQGDTVEHTTGKYFTLTLTVSAEFSPYAESEQGALLIQSLRQTFCGFLTVDEFNLVIEN